MVKYDFFNSVFEGIGKLASVRTENFDTVKFKRVVSCGNHNTCIGIVFAYKISNRRSRNYPENVNICTYRAKSCNKCALEHIARKSCVLTD